MSEGYNSGYGQARADAVQRIEEALATVKYGLEHASKHAPEEIQSQLRQKHEALIWARALIKELRPKKQKEEPAMSGTKPLVIYHGGCLDGFTAAWCMYQRFGAEAEYTPAFYGQTAPEVKGREVYLVDFSYPREMLLRMHAEAASLLVLDHHKTAEEDLKGLEWAQFDMNRSGAGMAWDWAFPHKPRPVFVDYVEDRDLWRFALESSKAVNAYISAQEMTLSRWDELSKLTCIYMASAGQGVLHYVDRYVREMSLQAQKQPFLGYADIPVVNAPYINTSELVGALAEGALFAVGWFLRGDGKVQYSLRSRGEFDVSALAKSQGGGGHKNAAGFVIELDKAHLLLT